MRNAIYTSVATLVPIAVAGAILWLVLPRLGYLLGIPDDPHGLETAFALTVCVATAVIGFIIGVFAYPVVLRPFASSSQFWGWVESTQMVSVLLLGATLERWATLLYGKREKH
jgi:hypothetical protein